MTKSTPEQRKEMVQNMLSISWNLEHIKEVKSKKGAFIPSGDSENNHKKLMEQYTTETN